MIQITKNIIKNLPNSAKLIIFENKRRENILKKNICSQIKIEKN